MTLKIYKKSEEELTCRFKIDISNLTNFDFNWLLVTKVYNVSTRNSDLWFGK